MEWCLSWDIPHPKVPASILQHNRQKFVWIMNCISRNLRMQKKTPGWSSASAEFVILCGPILWYNFKSLLCSIYKKVVLHTIEARHMNTFFLIIYTVCYDFRVWKWWHFRALACSTLSTLWYRFYVKHIQPRSSNESWVCKYTFLR